MRVCLLVVIVASVVVAPVMGDVTVITRVDAARGNPAYFTGGVIVPEIEIWGFNIGTPLEDYEVGRLYSVLESENVSILGGGYIAWWPHDEKWFVLPWVTVNAKVGEIKFHTDLSQYVPLNGGPDVFFSNETSLMTNVTDSTSVGVTAKWWRQARCSCAIIFGPIVKSKLSDKVSLTTQYCPWGGSAPDNFRLCLVTSF